MVKTTGFCILDNEIEKIILKDKKILIRRKEKKAVGLWFEQWEIVNHNITFLKKLRWQ
jgi:hypothetical protein